MQPASSSRTRKRASPWPPEQGHWTYKDWQRLPADGFKYEVLDGVLYMAPAPRLPHQFSSGNLFGQMWNHVRARALGVVLCAPTDVRIPGQPVPVQPDILFVKKARLNIIKDDIVDGAPDLVVEILSPANWTYDRGEKFRAYEKAGIPEYWIVDYRLKCIEVFLLEGQTYVLQGKWEAGQTVASRALEGFSVRVNEIFTH